MDYWFIYIFIYFLSIYFRFTNKMEVRWKTRNMILIWWNSGIWSEKETDRLINQIIGFYWSEFDIIDCLDKNWSFWLFLIFSLSSNLFLLLMKTSEEEILKRIIPNNPRTKRVGLNNSDSVMRSGTLRPQSSACPDSVAVVTCRARRGRWERPGRRGGAEQSDPRWATAFSGSGHVLVGPGSGQK